MTDDTTDIQWFIARDGKQHGPLTDIEMRTFIAHSYLRATDLIWRPGMPEWVVATLVFPQVFQPGGDPIAPSSQASPQTTDPQTTSTQGTSGSGAEPGASSSARQATTRTQGNTGPDHSSRSAAPHSPSTNTANTQSYGHGADFSSTPDRSEFSYDNIEPTSIKDPRSKRRMILAASTLALLGGGAYALNSYQEPIAAIVSEIGGSSSSETEEVAAEASTEKDAGSTPTVRADVASTSAGATKPQPRESSNPGATMQIPGIAVTLPPEPGSGGLTEFQTAALPPEPSPQPPPSIAGSEIDKKLQKIPAWALIKSEFPDWYVKHIAAAETMSGQNRSQSDIAQHLAQGLVSLRRQNAEKALAASPEKLERVAVAFLDNLRSLREQSVSACYGFISKGEASPAVVQLMEDPEAATTFHAQIAAIFDAISEGSKAPHEKKAAVKADYDMLIRELGKLGWKEEDLQVFSNPRLLSQREPDQVCKMVQDWFVAHLAVADQQARNRLLYETLKPVVSG